MKISFSNSEKVNKNDYKTSYGPTKRRIARWQWYMVVILLISPLLYLSYRIIYVQVDKSFRGVVSLKKYGISAPENGYIKKINVQLGSKVKKGQ